MLLKPSGSVAHVGGQVTKPGEPHYELIRNWIANGAQLKLDTPRVSRSKSSRATQSPARRRKAAVPRPCHLRRRQAKDVTRESSSKPATSTCLG